MLSTPSLFSKNPWMQLTRGLPSHWSSPDKEHQKVREKLTPHLIFDVKWLLFKVSVGKSSPYKASSKPCQRLSEGGARGHWKEKTRTQHWQYQDGLYTKPHSRRPLSNWERQQQQKSKCSLTTWKLLCFLALRNSLALNCTVPMMRSVWKPSKLQLLNEFKRTKSSGSQSNLIAGGDAAQPLRVYTALAEDWHFVSSTYTHPVAQKCLLTPVPENSTFLASSSTHTHMYIPTHIPKIPYKIKP